MLKIRGSILVDITGVGLSDIASSPFCTPQHPTLLADFLPRLPKLPSVPQQKYRLFAPKNRKFKLPEQVSQSAGRQVETIAEEGRRQWGGPTQSIVKQSGGFGSAPSVRLKTDRYTTHLGASDDLSERFVVRQQQQRQQ